MTAKQHKEYLAREAKRQRMIDLIQAALTRFDADELLEMMFYNCSNTEREELNDKMIDLSTLNGAYFIKPQTLEQSCKLEDFVSTQLFPTYNEQQAFLNFAV